MADAEVKISFSNNLIIFYKIITNKLKFLVFQLSKALKDLPNRVLNVPTDERAELFQNVSAVLKNSGKFFLFIFYHKNT